MGAVTPEVELAPKPPATLVLTGCEAVRAEVTKFSDWDARIMTAIAKAENGACDPLRHNLSASETHRNSKGGVICVGSYGVLQVGCLHYQAGENRDDLATNVVVAHRVWLNEGYRAWTMYKNGRYLQNL